MSQKSTFLLGATLAAAALFPLSAAQAQVGVTADVGTTGVGFHLVVPMEANLNGRFGVNYLKHDYSKTSNGVDFDMNAKLQTFDVLFDWYVRDASKFHVTGGLVYNGNKFNAVGKPNALGGFTLNGNSYSAADVGLLHGRIDYRRAAPYLGVGWGNALDQASKWNVNTDLGVFYQGHPNVGLTSVGCTTSLTVCSALLKDVAAERLSLQGDVDKLKLYPVLRMSVGYHF